MAHNIIRAKKAVFLSFDIETGGEYCGILQLSAEILRFDVIPKRTTKGETTTNDSIANIGRNTKAFNSYVNPGEGAIFGESATAIHGLHENYPSIVNAGEVHAVWERFYS